MTEIIALNAPDTAAIAQLASLYRLAGWWEEASDNADVIRRIVEGSHVFAVAVDGERFVGMGRALSDRASDAYIQDVTVHPDWRGQGIAKRLISALVTRLRADGISWIGLIAERSTGELYVKLGFKPMANSTPMLYDRES